MLGQRLDYFVLRSLAHKHNLATEEDLDRAYPDAIDGEDEHACTRLQKVVSRFEGRFPLAPSLRYLDMGCGSGEMTLALAHASGAEVTGIDILPRNIERARSLAHKRGDPAGVRFLCQDLHTWVPATAEQFDVLLSLDAMEHIASPRAFLATMADILAPGGVAVLAFGPLFHSPFGDHMGHFFRVQVPWRGVLFSQAAILRVRRACYRPTDPAETYADVASGLNLMRYSEFLRDVKATGWHFDFLAVNTFLRPRSVLRSLSDRLTSVDRLGDYFVHNVYAILRRRQGT